MELAETIESINKQLVDHFGIDTASSNPIFRVVWADDQREMRKTKFTESGLELLWPIVAERTKYPWIKERYILERYVEVPEYQQEELAGAKTSYECIWKFEGQNAQAVPPMFWACKFIIDALYAALGKKSMAKYVDDAAKDPINYRQKRVDKLYEELFGDESGLEGKTFKGEGIVVPNNYQK